MMNARAVRYRRLALAETDSANAVLLQRLADEAERGVLCVADKAYGSSSAAAVADPVIVGL